MAQATKGMNGTSRERTRRRLSLSLRFSLLVLLAALLPLAAVVSINDYFSRPTLIDQGRTALSSDANANSKLIELYMRERLLDGFALASLPTAPWFLTCAEAPTPPPALDCPVNQDALYRESVGRALAVGIQRDKNYTLWNIYDAAGHLRLSSDLKTMSTGGAPIPREDLTPVQQGNPWISAVSYNAQTQHAYVRFYTPITPQIGQKQPVLGFLQATLQIDPIWKIVSGETNANGAGSYAFITDASGIRIADPHTADLFTSVQPLDAATQSTIASENRFGSGSSVQEVNLPDVASALQSSSQQQSFVGAAQPGSKTQYQFVSVHMQLDPIPLYGSVPLSWTYFTLSPLSTVTQVADYQLRNSLIIAGIIAVLAALIGLFVGTRTARPVENSAVDLTNAAAILKALASRQQSSAGEQHWVVDACKTGLDGVRYLSDAMNQAARRLIDASQWFNEYWDRLTEEQARRTVQHLQELAHYIDEAARRQQASAERLDKAIMVTMQVSDQLLTGATEATQSAIQLERVVRELQHVVGGLERPLGASEDAMDISMALAPVNRPMSAPNSNSGMADFGGMAALPPAQTPRALTSSASPSGRIAPRAPRPAWGSKSQVGGWDAYNGAVGPDDGMNGQPGYNNYRGQGVANSPSRMGYDSPDRRPREREGW